MLKRFNLLKITLQLYLLLALSLSLSANPKDKVQPEKNRHDKKSNKAGAKKDPAEMTIEEFEAQLKYQQGKVVLGDGFAILNIPNNFRYLNPEQSEMILVQAWGNPPGQKSLGMIFPATVSPLSEN